MNRFRDSQQITSRPYPVKNYTKRTVHYDQWDLSQGCKISLTPEHHVVCNSNKEQSHMIISVDAETAFDKI